MAQMEGVVRRLVLNYTDCVPYTNADVSWGELEGSVTVSDVMFVGAILEAIFRETFVQRLMDLYLIEILPWKD